jgi:hypothetical protein
MLTLPVFIHIAGLPDSRGNSLPLDGYVPQALCADVGQTILVTSLLLHKPAVLSSNLRKNAGCYLCLSFLSIDFFIQDKQMCKLQAAHCTAIIDVVSDAFDSETID